MNNNNSEYYLIVGNMKAARCPMTKGYGFKEWFNSFEPQLKRFIAKRFVAMSYHRSYNKYSYITLARNLLRTIKVLNNTNIMQIYQIDEHWVLTQCYWFYHKDEFEEAQKRSQ